MANNHAVGAEPKVDKVRIDATADKTDAAAAFAAAMAGG